jgi:Lipase (class 3)
MYNSLLQVHDAQASTLRKLPQASHMNILLVLFSYLATLFVVNVNGALPTTFGHLESRTISQALFNSLEELARLVDIAYCVGSTGIYKPFRCLSRCDEFEGFELVSSWHTGPLLSDSCGYIALSHPPFPKRIIVAFRGTYSIANTIADLSTIPAEYVPFPADGGHGDEVCASENEDNTPFNNQNTGSTKPPLGPKCENCTVHLGFMTSWMNTRCIIIPHIERALAEFPDYRVTLVGHSLGGAVAGLASLEFQARGWEPQVTTFGEPRIGNQALNSYIDHRFNLSHQDSSKNAYRRVTHVSDPVPLLPLEEWGYGAHAGEIYISKYDLPPTVGDLEHCTGDKDPRCIAGPRDSELNSGKWFEERNIWQIPARYKLWQLFFAHRDYFWRLGLCVPQQGDWWPPAQIPVAVEGL